MPEAPHDVASLNAWMAAQCLTSPRLADLLGVSLYTVMGWRKGERMRPIVQRALLDVARARTLAEPWAALTREGGPEMLTEWRIDRGLSVRGLARALDVAPSTVNPTWLRRPLHVYEARAVRQLDRELRRAQPKPRA